MKRLVSILALVFVTGCMLFTEPSPNTRCGPVDSLALVDTNQTAFDSDTLYITIQTCVTRHSGHPTPTP